MSGRVALQRLIFRLAHDAALVDALRADPTAVLRDAGLSPQERGWLLAQDSRAYCVDPQVAARTLVILREELSVSATLTVRSVGPGKLSAFFGTPFFHDSVQRGTSLVLALADFLRTEAENGAIPDRRVRWTARVEQEEARVRRVRVCELQAGVPYCLSPCTALLRVPAGTLELFHELTTWLSERDAPDGEPRQGPALRELSQIAERDLLVERSAADAARVRLSYVTPELACLLGAARAGGPGRPGGAQAVRQRAGELGASADEQEAILRQLCADGLLLSTATRK